MSISLRTALGGDTAVLEQGVQRKYGSQGAPKVCAEDQRALNNCPKRHVRRSLVACQIVSARQAELPRCTTINRSEGAEMTTAAQARSAALKGTSSMSASFHAPFLAKRDRPVLPSRFSRMPAQLALMFKLIS